MSAPIDDGGPVFPLKEHVLHASTGLSLRDFFAGLALLGMASRENGFFDDKPTHQAKTAYKAADAMIAARKDPK